ncbi:serine/threonine protein kinase [Corallococcus sp. M34]|uniref:ATP-binding protein n=1 Tax=Citreicoccus inhibens TaxID=2849499 RepID=UPI001C24108D|nr:ATP-binding protein [Citreicoccus inhibens]MBU8895631.1 serine/threonine protein kinase [Citreicoccus inhibens]
MNADGLHAQLLRVLQGFMSETAARLVLRGTLEPLKLSASSLRAEDLPRIIEALEPASRHFMHPAQRPRLAAELKGMATGVPAARASVPGLGTRPTPSAPMEAAPPALVVRPATLTIRSEADASSARLTARTLCEELGGRGFECQKVATAVSELARNQLSYAGGGIIHLHPERTPKRMLRVRAEDKGQGIPNVELVLSGNYRSKTGMGLGLLGVKRLADRFDVRTGPAGTQVEFEVWL